MRLVDADIKVSDYIETWQCECSENGTQTVMAVEDLQYLPTIDAAPVVHGRVLDNGNPICGPCSVCGESTNRRARYCSMCGARMGGEGHG